jgi:glutamine synthetase adenylyltransferase
MHRKEALADLSRILCRAQAGTETRSRLSRRRRRGAYQHVVIAMKDSAGLDDDEEIVATLEWAADALLRTALHDFEQPQ